MSAQLEALAPRRLSRGAPSPLFVAVWNDVVAPKTEPFRHVLEGLALESLRTIIARGPRPGDRVLDVGTAWGRLARAMAPVVGEGGHVTAIDCVTSYIETATREAAAAGVDNVTFVAGDAGCHPFEPASFDLVTSLEGFMFFSRTSEALAHLGMCLVPGGRLLFTVPRTEAENTWMSLPKAVAREFLGLPPAGVSCGPGPFSLGVRADLVAVVQAGGFVDVSCEPIDEPLRMGKDLDAVIELHMSIGAVGELVRLHAVDGARLAELRQRLRERLAPFASDAGVIFPAAFWLVEARVP